MDNFKYSLEKYSGTNSRFFCPECGKKEFVRYIDSATGEYLSDFVGKCNRIERCNYHFKPKMYFEKEGIEFQFNSKIEKPIIAKPICFFDDFQLIDTLHSETKLSQLFIFFH